MTKVKYEIRMGLTLINRNLSIFTQLHIGEEFLRPV